MAVVAVYHGTMIQGRLMQTPASTQQLVEAKYHRHQEGDDVLDDEEGRKAGDDAPRKCRGQAWRGVVEPQHLVGPPIERVQRGVKGHGSHQYRGGREDD